MRGDAGFWEGWGVGAGPQGRPAEPGDGGRRPPETAAGGLPCGQDCRFAGGLRRGGQLAGGGREGRGKGWAGGCGGQVRAADQTVRRTVSAGYARRPRRSRGGLRPCLPPAQNGPRSYRNRKTVSAAREWWRRSGRPTTVQGVSAPVRRTVSGTRYFCARPTLRGCSTLAPCSAISSISS